MKINKLKAISIAVCCLVASLWSEAQGMEKQADILDSATVNRTSGMQSTTQNEIDSLDFESTRTGSINVEDSQTSWASYLISPVKSNIRMAYDVLDYMVQNPKVGVVAVLGLSCHMVAAAQQSWCHCYFIVPGSQNNAGKWHPEWLQNVSADLCDYGCISACNKYGVRYLNDNMFHKASGCSTRPW